MVDHQYPASSPLTWVPDVFFEIARAMNYRERCTSAHVSRAWREALLGTPSLWTHLVVILKQNKSDSWVSVLKVLLNRACGQPLTIELEWAYDNQPMFSKLSRVFSLLSQYMSTIRSLSLAVPSMEQLELFTNPAPILEELRIHINWDGYVMPMPHRIFRGKAPRLRKLYLALGCLPEERCPAIAGITHLTFHVQNTRIYLLIQSIDLSISCLKELTMTIDGRRRDKIAARYSKPLVMRINHNYGVSDILGHFPNATSWTYSCQASGGGLNATIQHALSSACQPSVLEICWTPIRAGLPWFSNDRYGLQVSLDGKPVLVDAKLGDLRESLSGNILRTLIAHLRTLCVPEKLWDIFAATSLPPSLHVTLFIQDYAEWSESINASPTPHPRHDIAKLTLARPYYKRRMDVEIISSAVLIKFLDQTLRPGSLREITLQGFHLDAPEMLKDVVPRVSYEHESADMSEPWTWEVDNEAALV